LALVNVLAKLWDCKTQCSAS